MNFSCFHPRALALVALSIAGSSLPLNAQSFTFLPTSDTSDWMAGENWSPSAVPDGPDVSVVFQENSGTAPAKARLEDSVVEVGHLEADLSSGNWELVRRRTGAALRWTVSGGAPSLTVQNDSTSARTFAVRVPLLDALLGPPAPLEIYKTGTGSGETRVSFFEDNTGFTGGFHVKSDQSLVLSFTEANTLAGNEVRFLNGSGTVRVGFGDSEQTFGGRFIADLTGSELRLQTGASSGTKTTYNGTIEGAGNVRLSTYNGADLELGGINSYTGDTTVAGRARLVFNRVENFGTGDQLQFIVSSGASPTLAWAEGNADDLTLKGDGSARNVHFHNANVTFDTGSNDVSLSGPITSNMSATAGLTKRGEGVLRLLNQNQYGTSTEVLEGTLLVNNETGSGTGEAAVAVSAALGGTGLLRPGADRSIEIQAGGVLTPGDAAINDGIGELTIDLTQTTGALLFADTSSLRFDLGAGLASDLLSITSSRSESVIFAGETWIDLYDRSGGGLEEGDYLLFAAESADIYNGLSLLDTMITGGLQLRLGLDGYHSGLFLDEGNIVLRVQAVPEPGVMALLGIAGVFVFLGYRRKRAITTAVAATGIAASLPLHADPEGNAFWKFNPEHERVSENASEGWVVRNGKGEIIPEGVQLLPGNGRSMTVLRYLPFFGPLQEDRFLQVEAHSEGDVDEIKGWVLNVSQGGSTLGPLVQGLNSYHLLQHDFFTKERTGKRGTWALRFDLNRDVSKITGMQVTRLPPDGIVIETGAQSEGVPEEGDRLRITLYTTDPDLRSQETISAELIALTREHRRKVVPWPHAGGPKVVLNLEKQGVFTGELQLDRETIRMLGERPSSPSLGVRVVTGKGPLIGWVAFPGLKDAMAANPIDWQHRIGEETESWKTWAALTQGEELARGKPVHYVPRPNAGLSTDENDAYDLTDGKLSPRKDDRIWFTKEAVGWSAVSGSVQPVTLQVDLGRMEPVGQIAIRLLGGAEQRSLHLPGRLEFYASEDGETYHLLGQMHKLMPAEAMLSDFKTAFFVPEEGVAFVHAFTCSEPVQARYIAIRIDPTASLFSDQISILRASPEAELRPLASYPSNPFFGNGVVVRPRQPEVTLLTGASAPNWFLIENYNEEPYQKLELELDLPAGVRLLPEKNLQISESGPGEGSRRLYRITGVENLKRLRFPLRLLRDQAAPVINEDEELIVTTLADGEHSRRLSFPLRERALPEGPFAQNLDVSLAWFHEESALEWPDFFSEFRRLGFDAVSLFPRNWRKRNPERSWSEEKKAAGLKLVADARKHGYRILVNESPSSQMLRTAEAAKAAGVFQEEKDESLYLRSADGKLTTSPNPFYRGVYYQKGLRLVEEMVQLIRPDRIFWDIETWSRSAGRAQDDPVIREVWHKSGLSWDDFVTNAGTEMLHDLSSAVKKGMGEKPMPQIGLYASESVGPKVVMDGVFHWSKIFPNLLSYAMPSLYVQGRTADVRQSIRENYARVGREIVPWLTAGTYGPVDPPAIEWMILETILNGARGFTYYSFNDFDPLHFFYHTRGLVTLGRFERLLKEGAPRAHQGSNPALSYTCFASETEALVLVGNDARSADTQTVIPPVFPEGVTRRVSIDPGRGKAEALPQGEWKVEVSAGQYALYYQKRDEAE